MYIDDDQTPLQESVTGLAGCTAVLRSTNLRLFYVNTFLLALFVNVNRANQVLFRANG